MGARGPVGRAGRCLTAYTTSKCSARAPIRAPAPHVCFSLPHLKAAASQIVFRYFYDLQHFRLDQNMTCTTCARTALTSAAACLPAACARSDSHTCYQYAYCGTDASSQRQRYEHCVTAVNSQECLWLGSSQRRFGSRPKLVMTIALNKARLWCADCGNALYPVPAAVACKHLEH